MNFLFESEMALATMISREFTNYYDIVDDLDLQPHQVVIRFKESAPQEVRQQVLDYIEFIKKEYTI